MTEKHGQSEQAAEAVNIAELRREQQDQRDPSGHGMQVTPRQQQHVSETCQSGGSGPNSTNALWRI